MQITKQDLRNIGRGRFKNKYSNHVIYGMVVVVVAVAMIMSIGYLLDDGKDLPNIYQETNAENTIEVDGASSNKITIDGTEYKVIYRSTTSTLIEYSSLLGAVIGLVLLGCVYIWYYYEIEKAAKAFQYEAEKDNTLEIIDEERRINEV